MKPRIKYVFLKSKISCSIDEKLKCTTQCDEEFPSSSELKKHQNEKHVKKSDSKLYKCEVCDRMFTRNAALVQHMAEHVNDSSVS